MVASGMPDVTEHVVSEAQEAVYEGANTWQAAAELFVPGAGTVTSFFDAWGECTNR